MSNERKSSVVFKGIEKNAKKHRSTQVQHDHAPPPPKQPASQSTLLTCTRNIKNKRSIYQWSHWRLNDASVRSSIEISKILNLKQE